MSEPPVVVVGGGPAGLATSQQLAARGIDHRLLEKGPAIADAWTRLYDSLTLHTGKHLSALPGRAFPRGTPIFPHRDQFLDYLRGYVAHFRLPLETGAEVTGASRDTGGWRLTAAGAQLTARILVVATGILSNPYRPPLPGEGAFGGELLHSVHYRRPAPYAGRRVLVVGAGNSAGEIGSELADAGARVTVAVRSGAYVVPLRLAGVPIQYLAYLTARLPRPVQRALVRGIGRVGEALRGPAALPPAAPGRCLDVPLIGFHLADRIREGRIRLRRGIRRLTPDGAVFDDGEREGFDAILLATGYRAAVGFLGGGVSTDDCGFARRSDRVTSAEHPDLFFVGHNYDQRGGLYNLATDARLAARRIERRLVTERSQAA